MKKLLLVFLFLPFLANAQIITAIAGTHVAGYTGNGGPATTAEVYGPQGMCTDNAGKIYIAEYENFVVRVIDASGNINLFAGNRAMGIVPIGDGGPATAAQLGNASDVKIDNAGNVYICGGLNRIRKVNTSGIISTIVGNDTAGYSGDGGPATAAKVNAPYTMYVDGPGNVYFVDLNNNCIRKINTSGIISTFAGNTTAGFSGNGGPATAAQFNEPSDITADNLGNFYIADAGNSVIRKIDASGTVSTFAGNGLAGFFGDNGPATAAMLDNPYTVCTDAQNNVYVGDNANYRIRKVDNSGIITTIAGTGTVGYYGDGGPATAAGFYNISGISFDTSGNMIIADGTANVVRKITNLPAKVSTITNTGNVITIYPNPVNDVLHIDIAGAAGKSNVQMYSVYSIEGVVMMQGNLKEGGNSIPISSLPAGTYMVAVTNNAGEKVVRKFIRA